jgi:predicted HTH transcriptional regulator
MSFRQEVSSELGSLLSNHIIELQKTYLSPKETLVEDAAKRYLDLIAWGEPNSAKVLAEAEGISIRTIHSRLMNARKKGILESPGSGFRFNTGV